MWLGKFLDLEEDIKELRIKIEKQIFTNIKKNKLTPLEFTIIESIFNNQHISGYDLIRILNDHFAGTWEAQSGTIYPILSKLKRDGFLKISKVKSPVGPIKKVYSLTEAGEELLKIKVNKNFSDQLTFIENFLTELSSVYIHSLPEDQKKKSIEDVQKMLKQTIDNVISTLPTAVEFKIICKSCGEELTREGAQFCKKCGEALYS
ncbi:MAG: zinc-ribbon domain-containing protein [Promethearchaeota archaeon]|jgi:PadR family transcriptional regulator PadR|nr:MAG: zinc-ribbon domain-containing protein [Candidatus Lokiarchaeota archaeon]